MPVYSSKSMGSSDWNYTADMESWNPHVHPISVFWFLFTLIVGIILALVVGIGFQSPVPGGVIFFLTIILAFMLLTQLRVANEWDRVVVLRIGKFLKVYGPGLFFLVPFVDTIAKWIDTRVHTTTFVAEQTLTSDTVPVDVDAVMFWLVWDSQKAALEVEKYNEAVSWAAQTALRDLIGKTALSELLTGRDRLDKSLQEMIDARTEPWGVSVQSVEIRDITIPPALQDAMSRQAQAERERQARVILGDSERQIATKFAEAAEVYQNNPVAFHLRAMNMLFEGLKEKGSLMVIPSSALDSMNIGAIAGMYALGQTGIQPGLPTRKLEPPAPEKQG